ncbi:putative toxin-antitoxin system toxin component, PIN family [Nevskia ramosa]|uniref:putative toxin-antitoxin system toxin component, PIN family n=1 Tax=Nevskia ramosa TaxID=64002 RepID=UPI003D095BCE
MKAEASSESPYARVVVDTNVLISAALVPDGLPAGLVDWLLQHARLVFTEATFAELETRVWKPKFDRYISLEQRQALLGDLRSSALWADISDDLTRHHWSRDPDDDAFIRAAHAASANRLITGDDDLLVLQAVGPTVTLSPRAALEELREIRS